MVHMLLNMLATLVADNSYQLFGSCLIFCLPLHPLVAHMDYISPLLYRLGRWHDSK